MAMAHPTKQRGRSTSKEASRSGYPSTPSSNQPQIFFLIFFSTFLGVSRQGEFKNTIKIFLQKVHVENFFRKNRQNSDVSFSSTFSVLSYFGCFSAM
jgi:hypothetical protein